MLFAICVRNTSFQRKQYRRADVQEANRLHSSPCWFSSRAGLAAFHTVLNMPGLVQERHARAGRRAQIYFLLLLLFFLLVPK